MKKLPLGLQSFKKIREDGFLYVDKTHQIYQLINEASLYFLSRPRRFGKTLLLSTIREIFGGEKEQFEGLHIAEKTNWEWEKYPVLSFNLASYGHKVTHLERSLENAIESYATKFEILIEQEGSLSEQLKSLISRIGTRDKPVVFLVDEYDKPIVDFMTEKVQAKKNRDILRDFFLSLKRFGGTGDIYVCCLSQVFPSFQKCRYFLI